MRYLLLLILVLNAARLQAQSNKDTLTLYFDLNKRELNKYTKKSIDSLIYNDVIYQGQKIMIIGYADYLGSEKYNEGLSEERAKNIQQYLAQYGIKREDVTVCIGKGEIERKGITGKEGYAIDRKVDIVTLKRKHSGGKIAGQPIKKTQPITPVKPVKRTGNLEEDISSYKPGETFVLRNIYFPAESHDISGSLRTLNKLYNILLGHPSLKISIEGHVCCIGRNTADAYDIDTHDEHLSLNRAKAIYDYLVDKGIDSTRLRYIGLGKSRPIVAVEKNEDDAEKNRRVEIRILEK